MIIQGQRNGVNLKQLFYSPPSNVLAMRSFAGDGRKVISVQNQLKFTERELGQDDNDPD